MLLRLVGRLRRRRPRPRWLEDLTPDQRRVLATNLRELVESKRAIERRLNAGSHRA